MTLTTTAPAAAPTVTGPLRATVPLADLRRAVAWALHAVPHRPPVQVLRGVVLHAERGGLTVTGYNYEQLAAETIGAPGGSGRAVVPGRALADMLRAMPKGSDVVLRSDAAGTRLTIEAGDRDLYRLPLLPADDYPELPSIGDGLTRLSGPNLTVLSRALTAVGVDDTLPILTGILLEQTASGLTAAATDRYRLAVVDLPGATGLPPRLLVPAAPLRRATQAFRAERTVDLLHTPDGPTGPGRLTFRAGPRLVSTRLLDGAFPNYRSLLPAEDPFAGAVTLDRDAFADAVSAAATAAPRNAPIRLTTSAKSLLVEGGTEEPHSAYARREIDAVDSPHDPVAPTHIAFNPGYLLDGLSALLPGAIVVHRQAPTRPIVLSHPDDPAFRYLLMPVRLAG